VQPNVHCISPSVVLFRHSYLRPHKDATIISEIFQERDEAEQKCDAKLTFLFSTLSEQNKKLSAERDVVEQQNATISHELTMLKDAWSKEKATLVERHQEEIGGIVARYKSKEQKRKDENRSLRSTVAEQKHEISLLQAKVSETIERSSKLSKSEFLNAHQEPAGKAPQRAMKNRWT
jgi:hypothetical protein